MHGADDHRCKQWHVVHGYILTLLLLQQKPKLTLMAVVLDVLASYVQNMLTEMVKEEVHMLLGVSGEIDKMCTKLGDLKNSLADADRRNITDLGMQA